MKIQLSDHFTYKKLFRYTLPSIMMIIFTSIYSVVDGFFVSNFVGKTAFAAVNFIIPFLMILGSVGFMLGAGGSALIGKFLGQSNPQKANSVFSLLVYTTVVVGIVLAVVGIIIIRPVAVLLGAEGNMVDDCVIYGRIILAALPFYMLQMEFQSFFSTAEKPQLGLFVTLGAGLTNMILDALFVAMFRWGIVGAALATVLCQVVGGILPLFYFARNNSSLLKLGKTSIDFRALWQTTSNGFSEFLSNVSASIIGMLYNMQLMKYAGENGIATYGVLMYVSMIFFAIFLGYSVGSAPIVSYNYGAGNTDEMKNVFKKSMTIIASFSVIMFLSCLLLGKPMAEIFVGYDEELVKMTIKAFTIFSFSFLFCGISFFGSSFFTALNNGLVSAAISFMRTLVFQIVCIMILPLIFGINGIWFSIVASDMLATIAALIFIFALKKRYKY